MHHYTDRIHIRAGIDGCTVFHELFGGHVGPGADELPRLGPRAVAMSFGPIHPRDPEVDDLRLSCGIDEDVPMRWQPAVKIWAIPG